MAILRITLDRKTMKKIDEKIMPGEKPDVDKFIKELAQEMAMCYKEGMYEK